MSFLSPSMKPRVTPLLSTEATNPRKLVLEVLWICSLEDGMLSFREIKSCCTEIIGKASSWISRTNPSKTCSSSPTVWMKYLPTRDLGSTATIFLDFFSASRLLQMKYLSLASTTLNWRTFPTLAWSCDILKRDLYFVLSSASSSAVGNYCEMLLISSLSCT